MQKLKVLHSCYMFNGALTFESEVQIHVYPSSSHRFIRVIPFCESIVCNKIPSTARISNSKQFSIFWSA
ncbi:hypothetical protein H5410_054246 [Solanum commersonii]|uniref:Uncharacterized protein n=1 Tax=Solanum commersonii TaxID=4109 RepID=A0A9J5X626_SOLCO|nr:hypothetical protein H5410_054246 [Solanum commersonii]